ncbi:MAG: hypothetical protein MESAZ_02866 [Saezia sanguinis]
MACLPSVQKKEYPLYYHLSQAQVAKLVDAGDSKSPAARRDGSSPSLGTRKTKIIINVLAYRELAHFFMSLQMSYEIF